MWSLYLYIPHAITTLSNSNSTCNPIYHLSLYFHIEGGDIRGAFHGNFTKLSGFGFCRKLARMKTQQGTDKASKYILFTVFLWAVVLLTRASTVVVSNFSYRLSSLRFTSSQFASTYLFASTSARVPPPGPGRHKKN